MFFNLDSEEDAGGPSSYDRQTGNTTVLSISVPKTAHFMHFRHNTEVTAETQILSGVSFAKNLSSLCHYSMIQCVCGAK